MIDSIVFGAVLPRYPPLQYYDIPSVSLRGAAYHLMRKGVGNFKVRVGTLVAGHDAGSDRFEMPKLRSNPGLQVDKVIMPSKPHNGRAAAEPGVVGKSFYVDAIHPTDFGHRALADLLFEITWQGVVKVTRERVMAAEKLGRQQLAMGTAMEAVELGEEGAEGRKDAGRQRGLLLSPTKGRGAAEREQQREQNAAGQEGYTNSEKEEEEEGEDYEEDLPPPMVPGTVDVSASTCFMQVG
jgi:hypothetical protein